MSTKTKTEREVDQEEKKEEEKFKPSDYSCEILLEKTTADKANDKSFPTDAFNITYEVDGKDYFFISLHEFNKLIEENYFVEYEKYGTDYYGTSKEQLINNNEERITKKNEYIGNTK